MNAVIELEIECTGEREAKALEATLSPDNVSIPSDQKFTARRSGRTLRFHVESTRPTSGLSSITSILNDAKLFQEIWVIAS